MNAKIPEPNYTQCPNVLFDDYLKDMGEAELKVVLAAIRKTFGYHKDRDAISITQFMEVTGLSRQGVLNGIENAVTHGYLQLVGEGQRSIGIYALVVTSQRSRPVNEVDQSTNLTSSSLPSRPVTSQRSRPTKERVNKDKEKDTRKSANTPPKPKSQKPLPANRKAWQWEHIERYALEHPGIDELAMLDDQAMHPTLKQLPTKAIALDCIELYEEMKRNGKGSRDYGNLWIKTTFKPEYNTFKCMLWALPNYLKKDTQPALSELEKPASNMRENLKKMGITSINGKAI